MPDSRSSVAQPFLLGVISDTHGLLRPEALSALASVEHIIHAGDIGNIEILEALSRIAPVTAIRGNIDTHGACADLPATEMVEIAGKLFYLVHSVHDLDISPTAARVDAVISGHSHKPSIEIRKDTHKDTLKDVLYLNPGSAGPRRFQLPTTIACITITPRSLEARIIPIL